MSGHHFGFLVCLRRRLGPGTSPSLTPGLRKGYISASLGLRQGITQESRLSLAALPGEKRLRVSEGMKRSVSREGGRCHLSLGAHLQCYGTLPDVTHDVTTSAARATKMRLPGRRGRPLGVLRAPFFPPSPP